MKTVWDAGVRNELLERFARLQHNQRPKWGKMNAGQMVAHCTGPMRSAMGEMEVTEKWTPMRFRLLRYLVIYVLPWPKGAPTAPEFIHQGPEDLDRNRKALAAALERFAAHRGKPFRDHAAFGRLSEKDWGCLMWRHLDHHLTQFGV
ncbi:MAG: DUF1569 domain-containing protein [Bryobacterales bacterium]|nr:DUF1569 domain-containing protein [Bryobacterales bacterium]